MDKVEEKAVRDKLQDLDKDKVIELYLQKCFESDYLKDQLALTEKKLELACEELMEDLTFESEDDKHYTLQENIEYFKTKAKEMMKSE